MDRPEQSRTPAMAIESPSPSNPPADNPSAPGSETPKPVSGVGNDAKMDAANEFSGKPLLREDQVQNAVKFLSHPRVRSSPVVHRRSFLEKKGLTKEEIDEAFRRVPDPPSSATNGEAYTINPAMKPNSSTTSQRQDLVQTPQPAAAPVIVSTSPTKKLRQFHWSHALLAAGVVAASGAGTAVLFKKMVIPRLKMWIKKVVAEESEFEEDGASSNLAQEAAEAAQAAASAAAVVAKASQELLSTKNEERKYFEAFMGALDIQVKEMKSMGDAVRRLESKRDDRFSEDKLMQENILSMTTNGTINSSRRTPQHVKVNGPSNTNFGEVRPPSSPAFVESFSVPNRNSYTEVMAGELRAEKPPSMKPWEVARQAEQRPQSSDERLSWKTELNNGPSSEMTGTADDGPEPWWLKKSVEITDIEAGEVGKRFHYGMEADASQKQRGWMPPHPPAASAAATIRRPKVLVQKQQTGDEQSVASSDDGKEGEMRVPDSVAEAEKSFGISSSEIQERAVDFEV